MTGDPLILGVDFGTDSVRTVVLDAADGRELASGVAVYRRWAKGRYCDPAKNRFRQHPLDYVEGLAESVKAALAGAGRTAAGRVAGIGIDTTGSTPCAVDKAGTPLALTKGFEDDPDAMFVLWKDHTAVAEAEQINRVARTWGGTDFTKYEGGVYSSEWFWSKILHVLRSSPKVRNAAFSWVEHCDWMPALLTGTADPLALKRSRCAAGHKAMYSDSWGGLPSKAFLTRLDPKLADLRDRLFDHAHPADRPAGRLCAEWASSLGLREGIAIAMGAFDAHYGAIGAGARTGTLVKIIGTSTCDCAVASAKEKVQDVPGICGIVNGSIMPGYYGIEAGQSAVGDILKWWVEGVCRGDERLHAQLSAEAAALTPGQSGLVALDWNNGNRTILVDPLLTGLVVAMSALSFFSPWSKPFRTCAPESSTALTLALVVL